MAQRSSRVGNVTITETEWCNVPIIGEMAELASATNTPYLTLTKGRHCFDFEMNARCLPLPPSIDAGDNCFVRYHLKVLMNTPGMSFKKKQKVAVHCDGTYQPQYFDARGLAVQVCF